MEGIHSTDPANVERQLLRDMWQLRVRIGLMTDQGFFENMEFSEKEDERVNEAFRVLRKDREVDEQKQYKRLQHFIRKADLAHQLPMRTPSSFPPSEPASLEVPQSASKAEDVSKAGASVRDVFVLLQDAGDAKRDDRTGRVMGSVEARFVGYEESALGQFAGFRKEMLGWAADMEKRVRQLAEEEKKAEIEQIRQECALEVSKVRREGELRMERALNQLRDALREEADKEIRRELAKQQEQFEEKLTSKNEHLVKLQTELDRSKKELLKLKQDNQFFRETETLMKAVEKRRAVRERKPWSPSSIPSPVTSQSGMDFPRRNGYDAPTESSSRKRKEFLDANVSSSSGRSDSVVSTSSPMEEKSNLMPAVSDDGSRAEEASSISRQKPSALHTDFRKHWESAEKELRDERETAKTEQPKRGSVTISLDDLLNAHGGPSKRVAPTSNDDSAAETTADAGATSLHSHAVRTGVHDSASPHRKETAAGHGGRSGHDAGDGDGSHRRGSHYVTLGDFVAARSKHLAEETVSALDKGSTNQILVPDQEFKSPPKPKRSVPAAKPQEPERSQPPQGRDRGSKHLTMEELLKSMNVNDAAAGDRSVRDGDADEPAEKDTVEKAQAQKELGDALQSLRRRHIETLQTLEKFKVDDDDDADQTASDATPGRTEADTPGNKGVQSESGSSTPLNRKLDLSSASTVTATPSEAVPSGESTPLSKSVVSNSSAQSTPLRRRWSLLRSSSRGEM